MIKFQSPIFKVGRILFADNLSFQKNVQYHSRVNPVVKRGSILENLIKDKDKKKHWHMQIQSNPTPKKKNVFEKIYRPSKRESILNSVFVKNITDVLSTGDVAPDIIGKGIEITGVKISPCFRILNVFWQVPPNASNDSEDINETLNMKAPEIRSELISRNVVGRVPKIYFIRDYTNARIAAFEEAMKQIDLGPETESSVVPDDSFTKDIYAFRKKEVPKKYQVKEVLQTENQNQISIAPAKPLDMKSDVFGLNRDILMNKVIARKKKCIPEKSAVISPGSEDLFSKIPGEVFQNENANSDREKLIKQFHIERKLLMQKRNLKKDTNLHNIFVDDSYEDNEPGQDFADEDFIEEE